ncbi:MAG: hypothetical protein ACLFQ8_03470 [Candidatus Aenigmatarchaeota archaeon]
MLEQKETGSFGNEEVKEEIEGLENMLTWTENPKVVKKGIEKAVSMLPLYPEEVLGEVGCELGEALSFLEDVHYKSKVEAVLARVARNYAHKIEGEALQGMSSSDIWYVRWLSVWFVNNMAYEDPDSVSTDQLDVLLNDEDERVKEFARRVANRIEKLKVSQV